MGVYAQYMTLRSNSIITLKPKNVSFEEAACLPLGGLESQHFLKYSGLKFGSKVLVIGAGGSIGTMGIQLFKLLGAVVTGVDRNEKFEVMKKAGADQLIE